jgi:hypothetical protein
LARSDGVDGTLLAHSSVVDAFLAKIGSERATAGAKTAA